jgi:dTDP-glucose 4,6-dehydratase
MNVLVTGCAGFIGSHAASELTRLGHIVHGYDSLSYASNISAVSNIKTLDVNDICNTELLMERVTHYKIDTIVNFAAETHVDNSIKDVMPFIHSNINGVVSLLEVVKKTGIELIHISTDEVYGPALNNVTFHESSPLNPKNPYAASKASADLLIQSYKNTHSVNAKIIRPCNNFGPGQHGEKFIPTILRSLKAGKKIPVYGDGKQVREWLYVKDTARIIGKLVDEKIDFDTLNITSSCEMTNIDVIKQITSCLRLNHENVVDFIEDRPGHDFRYSIASDKLKSLIDIQVTDFSGAINETINSF